MSNTYLEKYEHLSHHEHEIKVKIYHNRKLRIKWRVWILWALMPFLGSNSFGRSRRKEESLTPVCKILLCSWNILFSLSLSLLWFLTIAPPTAFSLSLPCPPRNLLSNCLVTIYVLNLFGFHLNNPSGVIKKIIHNAINQYWNLNYIHIIFSRQSGIVLSCK